MLYIFCFYSGILFLVPWSPLEAKILRGWGSNGKKPSMGVWIFSWPHNWHELKCTTMILRERYSHVYFLWDSETPICGICKGGKEGDIEQISLPCGIHVDWYVSVISRFPEALTEEKLIYYAFKWFGWFLVLKFYSCKIWDNLTRLTK